MSWVLWDSERASGRKIFLQNLGWEEKQAGQEAAGSRQALTLYFLSLFKCPPGVPSSS